MAISRAKRASAPPPTLVVLVRHGVTPTTGKELPGRAPGLHLSDTGQQQAKTAATRIALMLSKRAGNGEGDKDKDRAKDKARKPSIAAVYASPLERTQETATPIAEAVGQPVQVDEGLLELDVGDWTGSSLADAMKKPEWKAVQRYPSGFRFPGGESFVEMQARIVEALARYRVAHPGEIVVAVSHADPIRAVVAHAMGTHLDLFQRVLVAPCSLTAIALGEGGPTVLTVNSTDDTRSLIP
jgi:broad specificity phosphatase PhoE